MVAFDDDDLDLDDIDLEAELELKLGGISLADDEIYGSDDEDAPPARS